MELIHALAELSPEDIESSWKIRHFNIMSMYPYVQLHHDYPEVIYSKQLDKNGSEFDAAECGRYFGFVKACIRPPKTLFLPILPYRAHSKLTFPLCAACSNANNHREPCQHSETERLITGVWASFELELALRNGYQVDWVHEIWNWGERRMGHYSWTTSRNF